MEKDKWLDNYTDQEIIQMYKNNVNAIKNISDVETIQLNYSNDFFVFLDIYNYTTTLEEWNTSFRMDISSALINDIDLSLDTSQLDFNYIDEYSNYRKFCDVVDVSKLPKILKYEGMDLH